VIRRVGRIALTLLLGLAGLGLGLVAVSALREATLSTHQPVSPGSKVEVTVKARSHNTEQIQTLEEAVEAQLLTCRLEVASDIVEEQAEPQQEGNEGIFTVVLQPQLDETNRRQFKGCVEDFVIDGLQMDVLEMRDLT
jgi:hypothetical protein